MVARNCKAPESPPCGGLTGLRMVRSSGLVAVESVGALTVECFSDPLGAPVDLSAPVLRLERPKLGPDEEEDAGDDRLDHTADARVFGDADFRGQTDVTARFFDDVGGSSPEEAGERRRVPLQPGGVPPEHDDQRGDRHQGEDDVLGGTGGSREHVRRDQARDDDGGAIEHEAQRQMPRYQAMLEDVLDVRGLVGEMGLEEGTGRTGNGHGRT